MNGLRSGNAAQADRTQRASDKRDQHIGSFDDGELKGALYAIGNTARVTFEGFEGYVNIDLGSLVEQAVEWVKKNTEVRDGSEG